MFKLEFHGEFEFLTNYFNSNGFPQFFIESHMHRFWRNVFEPNVHDTSDNTLKTMYFYFQVLALNQKNVRRRNCVL